MAQPDRPNFTLPGRIFFGAIALLTIYLFLRFFGFLPTAY
jgi:hypothetical protein